MGWGGERGGCMRMQHHGTGWRAIKGIRTLTKGLFTWRWGTPGKWGNPPFHIISHFNFITFTWSVEWPATCYLTYLGSATSMYKDPKITAQERRLSSRLAHRARVWIQAIECIQKVSLTINLIIEKKENLFSMNMWSIDDALSNFLPVNLGTGINVYQPVIRRIHDYRLFIWFLFASSLW